MTWLQNDALWCTSWFPHLVSRSLSASRYHPWLGCAELTRQLKCRSRWLPHSNGRLVPEACKYDVSGCGGFQRGTSCEATSSGCSTAWASIGSMENKTSRNLIELAFCTSMLVLRCSKLHLLAVYESTRLCEVLRFGMLRASVGSCKNFSPDSAKHVSPHGPGEVSCPLQRHSKHHAGS